MSKSDKMFTTKHTKRHEGHKLGDSSFLRGEHRGGVHEWSGTQINIQRGCENNCRYCYARFDAVKRHKKCTEFEWPMPIINQKLVDAKYPKYPADKQPIMFPSRHDITQLNISECICVLKKLLDAGNSVLIVSKPRWAVVPQMAEILLDYKNQITFRFTIGSTSDETLKFWEPNAPGFAERLACLQYCANKGYQTSVSCEPYLDGLVHLVYEATKEFVTESFWVGKLKNFKSRVDLFHIMPAKMKEFVEPLLAASTKEAVRAIYNMLKDKPLVRWKDSIRKIIPEAKNES
jgi:DNA repair photolyase